MQDLEDYNNAKNYLLNEQNVSRETFLQLEQYVELLLKWNEHINLISSNSAKHIWTRHILDSAQLIKYLDLERLFADHTYKHLIIIAPAKVLGYIRTHLSKSVKEMVALEIDKDFIHESPEHIQKEAFAHLI